MSEEGSDRLWKDPERELSSRLSRIEEETAGRATDKRGRPGQGTGDEGVIAATTTGFHFEPSSLLTSHFTLSAAAAAAASERSSPPIHQMLLRLLPQDPGPQPSSRKYASLA